MTGHINIHSIQKGKISVVPCRKTLDFPIQFSVGRMIPDSHHKSTGPTLNVNGDAEETSQPEETEE